MPFTEANMAKNQEPNPAAAEEKRPEETPIIPLGRMNYLLILLGVVVIVIGFLLMSGGKYTDPEVFNEEIYSPRRITLAPIVVLLGFAIEIFAIFYRSRSNS